MVTELHPPCNFHILAHIHASEHYSYYTLLPNLELHVHCEYQSATSTSELHACVEVVDSIDIKHYSAQNLLCLRMQSSSNALCCIYCMEKVQESVTQ